MHVDGGGVYVQCLISASCMNLRLKTSERLKGSKPAFPMMDVSSSDAGASMKGMACETFMETRAGDACVRHSCAPEMDVAKVVTAGAMKPIMVRIVGATEKLLE